MLVRLLLTIIFKVFLYGEDFDKFKDGLNAAIDFIETGEEKHELSASDNDTKDEISSTVDVSFEDLGDDADS